MMNKNLSVILVHPENPHNIGAVARAMKNMGAKDLRLVKPPAQWKEKGKKMAVSAYDILARARVFASTEKAVADLSFVAGTTRRRGKERNFVPFGKGIQEISKKSKKLKIGILFGKESKGLANQDLDFCDRFIRIPAHESFPSFNLSQAVMVTLFALRITTFSKKETNQERAPQLLKKQEVSSTIAVFKESLKALGYGKERSDVLNRITATFSGILRRSGLLHKEAQMIKGISRRIRERVKHGN